MLRIDYITLKPLQAAAAALMMLAVAACGNKPAPAAPAPPVEKADITARARAWADSLTERMDTAELISQLFMPALYARSDYWTVKQILEYGRDGIGGVVLLKGTVDEAREIIDSMAAVSDVAPFIAIDAEWGLNMRLADAPHFPANGRLGPKVEDQLMYDYGREVARECRQIGINMVLGPVLDVGEGNQFLGVRSFGGDAGRVSALGLSYGRGLQDGNVIPVAKHFPGHGTVGTDSHLGKGVIEASLQRLDSVDLVPFRDWAAAGMSAVMVGHLAVPAIDSRMYPAAVSHTVITDLLREDLGFDGLVLTDALNMLGAEGHDAVQAIRAGADLIVAPVNTDHEISKVTEAVRKGDVTLSELQTHARRVLFYKYLLRAPREHREPLETELTETIARRLGSPGSDYSRPSSRKEK